MPDEIELIDALKKFISTRRSQISETIQVIAC